MQPPFFAFMFRIACNTFVALCFLVLTLKAQIPPQPGANPNTIPPQGGGRPFNRPTAGNPNGLPPGALGRPGTSPIAPGTGAPSDPKPAIKPEDAIKEDGGVELQFPNTPLSQILLVYEDLTGLKIIRDANVEQATVSIETTGELPKEKAIMFIEKSLLLNGYAFVPSGEGMVKILAFDAKKPQTEGAPFFESAMDLPTTDQVVNFVVILKYLNGEDAIKAIDQVIPRHSYGVITAVPNAKALVVTENSNTVRAIIALLERLDTKPAETKSKTFQITRSDAEDIKKALDEILGTDEKNTNGGGRTPSIPQNQVGSVPGQPIQPQIPNEGISVSGGGSSNAAQEVPPKIISIARRNCLLVIASADTMEYITKLIEELDGASEIRNFVSRPLIYLDVTSAMSIISDAISRTEGGEGGEGGGANATSNPNGQNQNQTNGRNNQGNSGGLFGNNNANGGGFGNNGGGLGGGLGSGSGGGFGGGGGGNLQPLRQNNGPTSMVVGKTLLISDPTANSIFASGPPEHLRILNEIMDELDRRPQQILISAVIGDYSLSNATGFSLETAFRGRNGRSSGLFGQVGSSSGLPSIPTGSGTTASSSSPDARSAISAASAFASGNALNFYGGLGSGIDLVLNTLNTNSDFKVISRPSVFTLNNTAATISSGSSFPIASSTQSNFNGGNAGSGLLSNVQYQDVVLSLNIIPLINSKDELTLQISQQNSEQSGTTEISGNSYPTLTKQELNTTVICKNNGTVLLGGLIREEKSISHSGLPFLSNVPILRLLSGSRAKQGRQRELVIMIQPSIVDNMANLPPNLQHSPGSSPFSDETRATFNYEKTQKELINAPKAVPLDKPKISQRIRGLVEKLFY
jgi:type II secretion system protein D